MPARLVHKADFDSLMAARIWSRSTHFALHHLARGPQAPKAGRRKTGTEELSTEFLENISATVDKDPQMVWAGAMVPKRQARRAVTRNLLKRQIRQAFLRHEAALPRGLWLVRLRRGFDKAEFASARSQQLAEAASIELDELLVRGLTSPRQRVVGAV